MTVIATDGKTIAADSLTTMGARRDLRPFQKLVKAYGRIYAITGSVAVLSQLIEWHNEGCPKALLPEGNWGLLVVEWNTIIGYYCDEAPYRTLVDPPFALGSGGMFAEGAMHAGASPERAVEIAIKLDTLSGGPVQVFDIERELKR